MLDLDSRGYLVKFKAQRFEGDQQNKSKTTQIEYKHVKVSVSYLLNNLCILLIKF